MQPHDNRRTAVLLDPHPLWLDALEQVLVHVGIETIGRLTSPSEALALTETARPQLLVLDPEARDPELDGLECLREARARVPALRAVALSASDQPQRIEAAFVAGATAYVVKTAHAADLAMAVRQVFEHSLYFGKDYLAGVGPAPAPEAGELTRRELEIIRLVAEGRSNKQVAAVLWVTEQTVKFHLANIFRKLDVSNRTEASRWAYAHGLLSVEEAEASLA